MMALRARRVLWAGVMVVGLGLAGLISAPLFRGDAGPLPDRLTNTEFWTLVETMSEPSGFFQSDNLVSNEHSFQYVVPALEAAAQPGRVYLGVAPDQNFTYMLALKPQLAFIVDIRRGNLQTQLMYKALIELSADRADFVGRLFARPRPATLTASSTVEEIFEAYALTLSNLDTKAVVLDEMLTHLMVTRGFPLDEEDQRGIEEIYSQFVQFGPSITYSSSTANGRRGFGGRPGQGGRRRGSNFPTYADLMRQDDGTGTQRGYLATETQFQALKAMEDRNAIIPVVGDFAGPKALKAVGKYVGERGGVISAFYTSNVEQYLFRNGVWPGFYNNLETLPVDGRSVIIRSVSPNDGYLGPRQGPDGRANVLDPIAALVADFKAGRIRTYAHITGRVH
jgi:hypothetical protein